ncbi:Hypothetical predicted protein, partial [Paramuricea clavata]
TKQSYIPSFSSKKREIEYPTNFGFLGTPCIEYSHPMSHELQPNNSQKNALGTGVAKKLPSIQEIRSFVQHKNRNCHARTLSNNDAVFFNLNEFSDLEGDENNMKIWHIRLRSLCLVINYSIISVLREAEVEQLCYLGTILLYTKQITLINISYSQPRRNYLIMVTKELHSLLLLMNLNLLTKWVLISLKKSITFTLILKIWGRHDLLEFEVYNTHETTAHLSNFNTLTEEDVRTLIKECGKKNSAVDPMPTSLVIDLIDVLLPTITKIINLSLDSGTFADVWKCALVHPLLKTVGVDPPFVNCRPISNLQYISKLTEKVVFSQTHSHMMAHSLYPELQSSYRRYHSTETALLKVTNDILLKMNSQEVTLLVTLDLSSAFDTVNHEILLCRLRNEFGIHGKVLDWFKSYLHNRGQQISIEGILSQRFDLDSGVPQGSCLGPLLFITSGRLTPSRRLVIYASKLFKIFEDQLPDTHGYADDTQLYLSFKPSLSTSQEDALCAMESCIDKIRRWMIQDKLLMNDGKTEFLVIGTRQQLCKLQPISISVNNSVISPSPHIFYLGSWLDSNLNMTTHITKVCKACFFHLHNIRRIKKYLSRDNLLKVNTKYPIPLTRNYNNQRRLQPHHSKRLNNCDTSNSVADGSDQAFDRHEGHVLKGRRSHGGNCPRCPNSLCLKATKHFGVTNISRMQNFYISVKKIDRRRDHRLPSIRFIFDNLTGFIHHGKCLGSLLIESTSDKKVKHLVMQFSRNPIDGVKILNARTTQACLDQTQQTLSCFV